MTNPEDTTHHDIMQEVARLERRILTAIISFIAASFAGAFAIVFYFGQQDAKLEALNMNFIAQTAKVEVMDRDARSYGESIAEIKTELRTMNNNMTRILDYLSGKKQ